MEETERLKRRKLADILEEETKLGRKKNLEAKLKRKQEMENRLKKIKQKQLKSQQNPQSTTAESENTITETDNITEQELDNQQIEKDIDELFKSVLQKQQQNVTYEKITSS